jgi:CDP-diacylglycerol--glycerol-3-phosphate 3-phosphatidyltransferase
MLSEWLRKVTQGIRVPIARVLGGWGVSPNALTVCGYLLHLPAMWAVANGHLQLGGLGVLLASLFDALDGSVAREMGKSSVFGAFLDSTLDRYSEGTILFGLLLWCLRTGARLEVALAFAALLGSLMVSYTRARAEGVGVQCKEGLFTRFERIVAIVAGLLLRQVSLLLWVLAILTNVTALQRVYHVWRATQDDVQAKS